jgi:hypothetical protein
MGLPTDIPTLPLMINDQNGKRCYNSVQQNSKGRVSTAVVHLICNQGVGGSNPSPGTIFKETS